MGIRRYAVIRPGVKVRIARATHLAQAWRNVGLHDEDFGLFHGVRATVKTYTIKSGPVYGVVKVDAAPSWMVGGIHEEYLVRE